MVYIIRERLEKVKMEKALIEATLFLSGDPIDIDSLANIIAKDKKETKILLDEMIETRNNVNYGLVIVKIHDKYQLVIKDELYETLSQFFDTRRPYSLSNAAMEVLSIIAYNDNITRTQIDAIRGVNSDGVVTRLLDYELIEESGKTKKPGRPMGYMVTDKFYLTFGISSKKELPLLPEIDLENLKIEENIEE